MCSLAMTPDNEEHTSEKFAGVSHIELVFSSSLLSMWGAHAVFTCGRDRVDHESTFSPTTDFCLGLFSALLLEEAV